MSFLGYVAPFLWTASFLSLRLQGGALSQCSLWVHALSSHLVRSSWNVVSLWHGLFENDVMIFFWHWLPSVRLPATYFDNLGPTPTSWWSYSFSLQGKSNVDLSCQWFGFSMRIPTDFAYVQDCEIVSLHLFHCMYTAVQFLILLSRSMFPVGWGLFVWYQFWGFIKDVLGWIEIIIFTASWQIWLHGVINVPGRSLISQEVNLCKVYPL